MRSVDRRLFLRMLAGSAASVGFLPTLWAEDPVLERGFTMAAKPYTTGVEIARQLQIWEMEIQMKPMRMILSPTPTQSDPQQVWYLAYRVIPRPIIKSNVGADTDPVNVLDPPPGPPQLIPQLTLVTYDDRKTEVPVEIHVDQVIPAAVKKVNVIERPATPEQAFLDTISVTRPLPEPVAADAPEQPWIYGVATWSGVDPRTDFFKVIFQGFSNVYEVRGEGDDRRTWRKVLVQKFTCRGDEFDPNQREFEFDGKPFWEYQPDKKTSAENSAPAADNPFAAQ